MKPFFSRLGNVLLVILFCLITLYYLGAIYFDGPMNAGSFLNVVLAILWLAMVIFLARSKLSKARKWGFIAIAFLTVTLSRAMISPSNDRDWEPEYSKTCSVDVGEDGDVLTFHHFRNFIHTEDGSTEQWESRTYHLSKLEGIDLFFDAFGGEVLAHTILSFDFGDEGRVCLSIEARREKGEVYSPIGGLYKMYELQYIFGSEEDLVAVRTDIRREPVFLYRFNNSPENCRFYLTQMIGITNQVHKNPQFYHVILANCTTSLREQIPKKSRRGFDWRILLNGYLDSYLYEKNAFVTDGLSFEKYNEQAHINEAAGKVKDRSKFSRAIRENRVGF